MGLKKLLIPLMVLLIASMAFAITDDVTVVNPAGQTFFPVLNNERFMDINFTVIDANSTTPIHKATIQFAIGDTNTIIAQDLNLSSSNCTFKTDQVWTTPGASCEIRYTFPRTGTIIPTGSYVLDVNVVNFASGGILEIDYNSGVNTFSMNNRLVSNNVLAILVLSTLILAAIFVISIALFLGNVIDGNMMVLITVMGIGAIIGIILVSEFLTLLTP